MTGGGPGRPPPRSPQRAAMISAIAMIAATATMDQMVSRPTAVAMADLHGSCVQITHPPPARPIRPGASYCSAVPPPPGAIDASLGATPVASKKIVPLPDDANPRCPVVPAETGTAVE